MKYSIVLLAAIFCSYVSTGTSAPQERIIGGRSGRLADHPYIASLHLANAPICGATIISTRHVITAAHCFVNSTQPDDYTVIVGSEFYHPRGPFARTVAVESLIVHEKFNKKSNTNDIALLVLEEPLELIQGYIWPAELPKRNDALPFGKSGILTGWGLTREGDERSRTFRFNAVELPVLGDDICRAVYNPLVRAPFQFCAGNQQGGSGACDGDGGASLTINGKLLGVVSFSNGCARANFPGVFTNVAAYRNWIQQKTSLNNE